MTSQARFIHHGPSQSTTVSHPKHSTSPDVSEGDIHSRVMRNGANSSMVLNGETTQRTSMTLPSMTHTKGAQTLVTHTNQNRLPSVTNVPKTYQRRDSITHVPSPELEMREQHSKVKRREQARRHLSNSLSGPRTVLPALRRSQSFSAAAYLSAHPRVVRDTGSLGHKPQQDGVARESGLKRTCSLRGEGSPTNPLSLSLPQPPRHVSLAALVHELNTAVHYTPHRRDSRDLSLCDDIDDDVSNGVDQDELFELDPDLFPWRTRAADEATPRTLTPALRKLNRRRISSRIRTQQWVNQIEAKSGRGSKAEVKTSLEKPNVSLIFEQET